MIVLVVARVEAGSSDEVGSSGKESLSERVMLVLFTIDAGAAKVSACS
jgi:hypothetical protein